MAVELGLPRSREVTGGDRLAEFLQTGRWCLGGHEGGGIRPGAVTVLNEDNLGLGRERGLGAAGLGVDVFDVTFIVGVAGHEHGTYVNLLAGLWLDWVGPVLLDTVPLGLLAGIDFCNPDVENVSPHAVERGEDGVPELVRGGHCCSRVRRGGLRASRRRAGGAEGHYRPAGDRERGDADSGRDHTGRRPGPPDAQTPSGARL